jgi:tetratricopeptide (TPR) repeat protein
MGLLVAQPAWSVAADAGAEAKKHFEEGTKAYNLGEFNRAVTEYRAAYSAKPDPVFLYNIAQAYRLGGDLQQALFFYKSFLRNVPSAPIRKEIEERIAKIEAQMSQQKALATAPPYNTVAPGSMPTSTGGTGGEAPPADAKPPEPKSVDTAAAAASAGAQTATSAPSSATASAAASTTTTPAVASANKAPAAPAPTPVYKKWWLWAIVGGVVVAGAAAGAGAAAASGGSIATPSTSLGNTVVTF